MCRTQAAVSFDTSAEVGVSCHSTGSMAVGRYQTCLVSEEDLQATAHGDQLAACIICVRSAIQSSSAPSVHPVGQSVHAMEQSGICDLRTLTSGLACEGVDDVARRFDIGDFFSLYTAESASQCS